MKLKIERTAWHKIESYARQCPDEISGLGKVRIEGEELIVEDVAIFEQKVSGAHSTITTEALAKFQVELIHKGENPKHWTLWWHSHAQMAVFFSKTDTDTIESSTEFPYLVSLVVNKKRESKARLDVFQPIHLYVELEVEVLDVANKDIDDVCQAEITEKVGRAYTHVQKDWKLKPRQEYLPYRESMDDEREYFGEGAVAAEYWQHKGFLRTQILHLVAQVAKHPNSTKKAEALEKRRAEFAEHETWGRSMGLEIGRAGDFLPIIGGK